MSNQTKNSPLNRYDLQIIADWIEPESKVLDLGCGDGRLMRHLQQTKAATGYGIELSPDMIAKCIENGINVIQTNLDKGLIHFEENSFDFVVLSLTLQAMRNPKRLLEEMLRVGRCGIVTFPNFAYWRNRMQMALGGKMPVSEELPHKWFNTPNIHLCTIHDFTELCEDLEINIDESIAVSANGDTNLGLRLAPNLFGEIALCKFSRS